MLRTNGPLEHVGLRQQNWALQPDGKVDRVIDMPVKTVTGGMFDGPNLDVPYVTSTAKPPLPRFLGDGALRGSSLFAVYNLCVRSAREPRSAS